MKVAQTPKKQEIKQPQPETKQPEPITLKELIEAAENGHIGIITTAFEKHHSILKEHRKKLFDTAKANGKSDVMNFLADKFPDLKPFLPPDIT